MTKKLGKHLNAQSRLALVWIVLIFGMLVRPCVGSLPTPECSVRLSAARSLTSNNTEHIRNWVIGKYDSFRFVYRVAMQLRALHAEENALERKHKRPEK